MMYAADMAKVLVIARYVRTEFEEMMVRRKRIEATRGGLVRRMIRWWRHFRYTEMPS